MIRVGIAGCGAVARTYYRPAFVQLENSGTLRLMAAFDPDASAASEFVEAFDSAMAVSAFDALFQKELDCLIIASPPALHCGQAIAALRRGVSVHCEKPLAISLEEGERMVEQADRAGASLSVGMVRRRLALARAVDALLRSGAIGRLKSIDVFEGGLFRWPVSSPSYFDPAAGAVGVLEDLGSHALDLLTWWIGVPEHVAYCDDAMGGVAANCRIELRFGETFADVRLSRDWHRPNRWRLSGEEGSICWDLDEWDSLVLATSPDGIGAKVPLSELKAADAGAATFEQAFVDQLAVLAAGERAGGYVTGAEALSTLRIIERCAQTRTLMDMPWLV